MLNDVLKWDVDVRRNAATQNILDAARSRLSFGERYTIVIFEPGDDALEHADIYEGNEAPPSLRSDLPSELRIYHTTGLNMSGKRPTEVVYIGWDEKVRVVNVNRDPLKSTPAASTNFIDHEPKDIIRHNDPRELPADSRFDSDHPMNREPGKLA
jgi:hypothetical protein